MIRYCVIFFIIFLITSCSRLENISVPNKGLLYTNITRPYTTNFNNTPVGTKTCRANAHQLKVRVSGEWGSKTFDNAMREAGMTKCYYADEKRLSLLLGLYRRTTLILYGD